MIMQQFVSGNSRFHISAMFFCAASPESSYLGGGIERDIELDAALFDEGCSVNHTLGKNILSKSNPLSDFQSSIHRFEGIGTDYANVGAPGKDVEPVGCLEGGPSDYEFDCSMFRVCTAASISRAANSSWGMDESRITRTVSAAVVLNGKHATKPKTTARMLEAFRE